MKLLTRKEATQGLKKSNDELLGTNIRLREMEKQVLKRLNEAKANYDPEKMKALKDFEQFTADLMEKKSKLLKELNAYDKLIEERKELYYGLVEKADKLLEEEYKIEEAHKKLDLRESFIVDLERRIREKQI